MQHAYMLIENDWHDFLLFPILDIRWVPFHEYMSSGNILIYINMKNYIARLNTSDGYVIWKTRNSNGYFYALCIER